MDMTTLDLGLSRHGKTNNTKAGCITLKSELSETLMGQPTPLGVVASPRPR